MEQSGEYTRQDVEAAAHEANAILSGLAGRMPGDLDPGVAFALGQAIGALSTAVWMMSQRST